MSISFLRGLAGVLVKDWPRYRRCLSGENQEYLAICNRHERLEAVSGGHGYLCKWQWTSDLHAPKFLPMLGRQLMEHAVRDHPVRRVSAPDRMDLAPDITFLIGHRGLERLPHLLATLESIAGQQGPTVECVVIEQDTHPRLAGRLPPWVRHVQTPPPDPAMPYCRAWAFNVGAKHARADVLVLHDNDMLVPSDYASHILRKIAEGYEVANLKRFIFYLTEAHSRGVASGTAALTDEPPLAVVQNLEGGGSVAITRAGYARIGGLDESFVGWGGEDNEFWERAQTLKVWPYAFLPLWHLWHAAQPEKHRDANPALERYRQLSAIPVPDRISQLATAPAGLASGPMGWIAAPVTAGSANGSQTA